MISLDKIDNIIFDLGGVILNIDYELSANAFKALGAENFDELYSQAKQSELFDQLETGKLEPSEFRDQVRRIFQVDWSDHEIDKAWNAMLLDLPEARLDLLKRLSKSYRIFLLSNTNRIHFEAYSQMLRSKFGLGDLSELFEKAYFSHQIGRRKPDKECFQFVLDQNDLSVSNTLFIDDSVQHIEGANRIGLKTYHLREEDILDLF
jgi:HAD superfamily hydrolase (TIGR01509 family)